MQTEKGANVELEKERLNNGKIKFTIICRGNSRS